MGKGTAETQPPDTNTHEGGGLHLHTRTVHPSVPLPYITRGDVKTAAQVATSMMPAKPPTKELVFYGGLGVMTLAGALEWPVALAVGGATWLVRSRRTDDGEAGGSTGEST